MKLILTVMAAALAMSAMAQTSLNTFEKINVSGSVHLTLVKGSDLSYETSGDTDGLKVKVEQGAVHISRKKAFSGWDKPTNVTLTYNTLRVINASAGAKVEYDGTINAGDFEVDFDTGASGDLTIDAQSLEASVGEGGVLRLAGSARAFEATTTTGGVLKAREFIAHNVYVKANTGATASVHATDSIEASASLGGSVSYTGDPPKVNVKESLGGSVRG